MAEDDKAAPEAPAEPAPIPAKGGGETAPLADIPSWPEHRHPLKHPIPLKPDDRDAGMLSEIVMREPDVAVLEAIDDIGFDVEKLTAGGRPSMRQMVLFIAALTGQPADVIRRLHTADFVDMGAASAPLLGAVVSALSM